MNGWMTGNMHLITEEFTAQDLVRNANLVHLGRTYKVIISYICSCSETLPLNCYLSWPQSSEFFSTLLKMSWHSRKGTALSLFDNSIIETWFICHIIHPLRVYSSQNCSAVTTLNFRAFSSPQTKTSYPPAVGPLSSPKSKSAFCLYGFACFGHSI